MVMTRAIPNHEKRFEMYYIIKEIKWNDDPKLYRTCHI